MARTGGKDGEARRAVNRRTSSICAGRASHHDPSQIWTTGRAYDRGQEEIADRILSDLFRTDDEKRVVAGYEALEEGAHSTRVRMVAQRSLVDSSLRSFESR